MNLRQQSTFCVFYLCVSIITVRVMTYIVLIIKISPETSLANSEITNPSCILVGNLCIFYNSKVSSIFELSGVSTSPYQRGFKV